MTVGERSLGHLLIIDDDADLRETLASILGAAGYAVDAVPNGAAGLEHLHHSRRLPDVIVLDLMMPVMNGWRFRVEQRKHPQLAAIPVIAITASQSPTAAAIDADKLLCKPFEESDLLSAVEEMVRAVKERKIQAERIARAERLAAIGQLAAGVAHEINNPLSYVLANLAQLERALPAVIEAAKPDGRPLPPDELRHLHELPEMLSDALDGARRITQIVRDIKVFSRRDERGPKPVQVQPVVEAALKMSQVRLRQRAQVHTAFQPTEPVLADADQLHQVFLNLLLNAADAIPEGSAEQHTIGVASRMENGRVIFEVSDTGVGIPPDVLRRLFEPFFTTKPLGQGTGLGLFVCQGLVASMGGELSVETRVDSGSTFRVTLPTAPLQEKKTTSEIVEEAPTGRSRILVIDDEVLVCRSLERMLKEHDVLFFTDAREAVEKVRGDEFDLILCDLHMPNMTGRELWETLSRDLPQQADRLVFMTAGLLSAPMLEFARTSPRPVLEKPIHPDDVVSLLGQSRRAQAPSASA